ncbi:MAG: PAS domain S-box protein [Sulfurimonas sp.]|nr:PAS domain S-box protein [Sulfurimonas sp.]
MQKIFSVLIKKLEDTLKLLDRNIIVSETNLQGIIVYASKAFCKISGYKEEELLGKSHNRLLLKQSITNPFQSLYLRVLNQG